MSNLESKPRQLGFGGEFSREKLTPLMPASRETLLKKNFWHGLPPTDRQIRSITRMCIALKIHEPLEERVSNRMEARNTIYELQGRLKSSNSKRR